MEPTAINQPASAEQPITPVSSVCSTCHQAILPEYYFCPNCGRKLSTPPLSTSAAAQAGLYAFSIVLPIICFLMITKWQGIQYLKSHDEKTKKIGAIALGLLILSTIYTTWQATVWIQGAIQSSVSGLNADMSGS